MSQTSLNGIEVSCDVTEVWPLAEAIPRRMTRAASWISAQDAAETMEQPAPAAEARARAVLDINPDDPYARLILAAAFMQQERWQDARGTLERLSQTHPQIDAVWRRFGRVLARAGERTRAIAAFERALDLDIRDKVAWYALGSLFAFSSAKEGGIEESGNDSVALKRQADGLIEKSRWPEAKRLLERCLHLAPDNLAARFRYATMLFVHGELRACVPQIDALLGRGCDMPLLRGAKAMALALDSNYAGAVESFDTFIAGCDSHPGLWMEYGRVLRWAGDGRMSAAFRKATEILPGYSAAWYALATAKSFRWDETLIGRMSAEIARQDLAIDDRALMHFALGKALEDLERYAEAFENFRMSKTLLGEMSDYRPKASQTAWRNTRILFTPAYIRQHSGTGSAAREPIFIVGMPRAGSTLVEQILSAHSQVEGLGELTVLPAIVERLYTRAGGPHHWPLLLHRQRPGDFRALGEEYLHAVRSLRKTDASFFTDKQPNNFQLAGLIHLMLPNAKIVDVRRHPLDCGFSCFTHYFPKGHRFACDLGDIGQRYADYVRLMAHFDDVLPGKVYRLTYERLVGDFETEVRRLLEYLGLPFESQCLRFFENRRTVITLSYEQVFMPLYDSGMGHWRHYEPWLGDLKEALGCVLEAYPGVPEFFADVHATSRAPRRLGEASGWFRTVKGLAQTPFAGRADVSAGSGFA